MNRNEAEEVEDCSELDPRAPGVWALGSFHEYAQENLPPQAAEVLVHVRDRKRPRRILRFARLLRRRAAASSPSPRAGH
jgi:hypothetical protein